MTFVSSRAASMSSGLLLEPIETPNNESSNTGQRFRPYSSPNHHVTKGRYITSNDPRGYIPVYEYPLNGQWIMLDMDDGYVLWTGIWKALGNSKADIVKIIESQPDIASKLRRVRGGYLKIQGTWMPYEIALRLARRVAWPIRHELIPLFGPTFPNTCLSPDKPGYGQVVKPGTGRRRTRRTYPTTTSPDTAHNWTVISAPTQVPADSSHTIMDPPFTYEPRRRPASGPASSGQHLGSPVQLHMPYNLPPSTSSPPSPIAESSSSSNRRYSPYANACGGPARLALHPPPYALYPVGGSSSQCIPHDIKLPPIQTPRNADLERRRSIIALPPITAMDDRKQDYRDDSAAVLRRLQSPDDDEEFGIGHAHPLDAPRPHGGSPHSAGTLPSMCHSGSTYSHSSPSIGYGSPRNSSIDSPVSPSVITPVSGRSSFDDTRIGGHSPLMSVAGGQGATVKASYHDDLYRGRGQSPPNAASGIHVGYRDPDLTARSWRPW